MNTVWVTGAQGFIGRHLAKHLSDSGSKVYGIGHGVWSEYEYRAWGLDGWLKGEIDTANLENLASISGLPMQIFHIAGGSSVGPSIATPLEDFNRTVASCIKLLDWVRTTSSGTCIVAASSAAVYGSGHDMAISETASIHPFSPYGHHKFMMEQLCRSYAETYGLRCVIVRLFSVYGPLLRKQLLWDLCSRLASGEKELCLGGTGQELRDWVEVRDVARLLKVAAMIDDNGVSIINGGSGIGTSVSDIAEMIVRAWGANCNVGFNGHGRPGDPFSLVADTSQLAKIGYQCKVPVEEGIRTYVEWFKESML